MTAVHWCIVGTIGNVADDKVQACPSPDLGMSAPVFREALSARKLSTSVRGDQVFQETKGRDYLGPVEEEES